MVRVVSDRCRLVWIRPADGHGPELRNLHGDFTAEPEAGGQGEVVTAPEAARVVPAGSAVVGKQSHGLVGDGEDLGTVGGFQLCITPGALRRRYPPGQPSRGDPGGGGERSAVQPRYGAQHGVFHLAADRWIELAQPCSLAVPGGPDDGHVAQVVE